MLSSSQIDRKQEKQKHCYDDHDIRARLLQKVTWQETPVSNRSVQFAVVVVDPSRERRKIAELRTRNYCTWLHKYSCRRENQSRSITVDE